MTYSELLTILNTSKEEEYASFQRRLIATRYTILGVRTPTMRKIAQTYKNDWTTISGFPNEYYEVVFIKLAIIAALPYEEFVRQIEYAVSLMDNWALCDCFKADCIKKRKDEFVPILEKLFRNGGEFYERYVLVVLLSRYAEEAYLPLIEDYIKRADSSKYYVYMAISWLTAEILVKHYDAGLKIIRSEILDSKTHNKAIQKAIESYRLSQEQKDVLRSLKKKKD